MITYLQQDILPLLEVYKDYPLGVCRFGAIYNTYGHTADFYRGDRGLLCKLDGAVFLLGDFDGDELQEFVSFIGATSISGEKGEWAKAFSPITTALIRLDDPEVYTDPQLNLYPERRAVYNLQASEMEGEIDPYHWMGDVALRQRKGTGVIGLYQEVSTASMLFLHGEYGILGGVATAKEQRHRGYATATIKALLGAIPSCTTVLGVTQTLELLPFYQKLGFYQIGEHCYVEL